MDLIKKRRHHYRGINRTLTDAERTARKRETIARNNQKYYIKNLERVRDANLLNYYIKKEYKQMTSRKGRPPKYIL